MSDPMITRFDELAAEGHPWAVTAIDHHSLHITAGFAEEEVTVFIGDLLVTPMQLTEPTMMLADGSIVPTGSPGVLAPVPGAVDQRLALAAMALAWARYRLDDAQAAYRGWWAKGFLHHLQAGAKVKPAERSLEAAPEFLEHKGAIARYAAIHEALGPIVSRLAPPGGREAL